MNPFPDYVPDWAKVIVLTMSVERLEKQLDESERTIQKLRTKNYQELTEQNNAPRFYRA